MSTPTNSAAWETDPFWSEVVRVMTEGKKLRADAYLQRLDSSELESLRLCLSLPVPFVVMREQAPKWRGGPHDGNPPGLSALSDLWHAIKQVEVLRNIERDNLLLEAARAKAKSLGIATDESMLDNLLLIVAQEVLNKSLSGEDPKSRTAAARLLLKRADQKRHDRDFEQEREKWLVSQKTKIDLAFDELEKAFKGNSDALKHFNIARDLVREKVDS
jgi:hypothetical protein